MEILKDSSSRTASHARGCLLAVRQHCVCLLAVLVLMFAGGNGVASAQAPLEYAVKGAFLVKLGGFVEWPANAWPAPSSPFVIGILGEDPFGADFDRSVQGVTVQGRPVVIKRYQRVEQTKDAQILYISATTPERREHILASLRDHDVLTVSDKSSQPGGIVTFVIQENKVRFEIDAEAAEHAGLRLSSKLLALAKPVDKR